MTQTAARITAHDEASATATANGWVESVNEFGVTRFERGAEKLTAVFHDSGAVSWFTVIKMADVIVDGMHNKMKNKRVALVSLLATQAPEGQL